MSQAFVREADDQWLSDVGPSVRALIAFLTRDNNGVRVYEKDNYPGPDGEVIYRMSDGMSYSKDSGGHWQLVA
jgi:hypothetical protein